jgi:hypothetical protein
MRTTLNSELIKKLLQQGSVYVTVNCSLADIAGSSDTGLRLKLVNTDTSHFSITDDGIIVEMTRPRIEGFVPYGSVYELSVSTSNDDLTLEYPVARPEIQEYLELHKKELERKIASIEMEYSLPEVVRAIESRVAPLYKEYEELEQSIVERYFEIRDMEHDSDKVGIEGEGEE